MAKLQLFFIRLALISGVLGLALKVATPALAAAAPSASPYSQSSSEILASNPGDDQPFDPWQFLLPLQNLAEMLIRLMSGAVGIAFALGTQKNAAVANFTHNLGMANQAAGSIFSIGMGIAFFLAFYMIPGIIKEVAKAVVTPQVMNDMTNLDWLKSLGN